MATPRLRIAKLDEATLEKLKAMEEEFGTRIVALEPYYPPANLTQAQVQRIKTMEQELGVVLLAYPKD